MGLIKKILGGGGKGKDAAPPPDSWDESDREGTSLEQTKERNSPRRDLVQLTLRETMRKHGIPSDWIDCRTLSVLTKQHKQGMHVQFLVRKADYQILPWIHALQESFWDQVLRTDPKAHDWLFSVGWEFYGKSQQGLPQVPGAESWKPEPDTQAPEIVADGLDDDGRREAGDTLPPDEADDIHDDLKKLQDLMSTRPAELTEDLPEPKKR